VRKRIFHPRKTPRRTPYPVKTSIVLTSNRGVGAWGDILGDTTVAAALLDRLLHRSVVLTLDGDSYRLRNHHARNDTLRATTTGTRRPLS
jgi:IstB-like ATP binding protein